MVLKIPFGHVTVCMSVKCVYVYVTMTVVFMNRQTCSYNDNNNSYTCQCKKNGYLLHLSVAVSVCCKALFSAAQLIKVKMQSVTSPLLKEIQA